MKISRSIAVWSVDRMAGQSVIGHVLIFRFQIIIIHVMQHHHHHRWCYLWLWYGTHNACDLPWLFSHAGTCSSWQLQVVTLRMKKLDTWHITPTIASSTTSETYCSPYAVVEWPRAASFCRKHRQPAEFQTTCASHCILYFKATDDEIFRRWWRSSSRIDPSVKIISERKPSAGALDWKR